jgi:hypothetical protein
MDVFLCGIRNILLGYGNMLIGKSILTFQKETAASTIKKTTFLGIPWRCI